MFFLTSISVFVISSFIGIIAAVLPGFHINNLVYFFDKSPYAYRFVFVSASTIFFIVFSIISSIALNITSSESFSTLFASQKYYKKGLSFVALLHSLRSMAVALLFSFPFVFLLFAYAKTINAYYGYFVLPSLFFALYLLLYKKHSLNALFLFFASSILGIIALRFSFVKNPLMPMMSGFYASSFLLLSLFEENKFKDQRILFIKSKSLKRNAIISNIASFIFSFMPGMGAAFSVFALKSFNIIRNNEDYLQISAANSLLVSLFAFVNYPLIHKARVLPARYIDTFSYKELFLLYVFSFIAIISAYFFSVFLLKIKLSRVLRFLALLLISSFFVFSINSFILYLASLSLGIFAIKKRLPRTLFLSSIIVPVIIHFI